MGRFEAGRQDVRVDTDHFVIVEHDDNCRQRTCECSRGTYHSCEFSSCYDCFLDRRAEYINCIYCDRWHSPEFDTCFQCRPQGRDEATADLKRVIFARDGLGCRYCGAREGDLQTDPRLIRPKCPPRCAIEHNHKEPCRPGCGRRHSHRKEGDPGNCEPHCHVQHPHLIKDDNGVRPARLHIDHIQPCARGGTADPWNLQTLCGVCNVTKGKDWWRGSRHHKARQLLMAAYLTYLWNFLDADQQESLACDAEFDEFGGLTGACAVSLVRQDYVDRVRSSRARARPAGPLVEDVPDEYKYLDLAPAPLAVT